MLTWRTINVFVSSTFLDMQVERDHLSRFLVPRLNDALRSKCIRVNLIDLRSGVNTRNYSESTKEKKVLEVCIQEIHNSKPYFIGIIGGRYGWVPSRDIMKSALRHLSDEERERLAPGFLDKSVTEFEMLVGMLCDHQLLDHSFVCLKDSISFRDIPENRRNDYVELEREVALNDLRVRIVDSFKAEGLYDTHIIPYKGIWEGDGYVELPGFVDGLYNALLDDILKEDESVLRPQNVYEEEEYRKDAFIGFLSQRFGGRDELITSEMAFLSRGAGLVRASSEYRGHCLVGFSGCGKSSVFAKLCSSFPEDGSHKRVILSHAAGVSLRSINFNHMIDGWNYQLSKLLGTQYEDTYHPQDTFTTLCRRVSVLGYKVVILIDSLDSFMPESLPNDFSFIPLGVPFLCTSLPRVAENLFKDTSRYKIIDIGSFSEEDAEVVISKKLGYKDIPDAMLLKTIRREDGKPAYISPLWLSMAVTRILELDARDYAIINKTEDRSIADLVCSLPAEAEEMFKVLLQRSFAYFGGAKIMPAFCIMACSRYGVTEAELNEILGKNWDILSFSRARQYFDEYISTNGLDKRMRFSHEILRQVVLKRDPEKVEKFHEKYLSFLLSQVDEYGFAASRDYQSEAIYQILQLDDESYLTSLYTAYSYLGEALYLVYCESPQQIINLLEKYIHRYGLKAIPLVTEFVKDAAGHVSGDNHRGLHVNKDLMRLSDLLIQDSLTRLRKGESWVAMNVDAEPFDCFDYPLSNYMSVNDTRSMMSALANMKESFRLLRKNEGNLFYKGNYDSFFSQWCSTLNYFVSAKSYMLARRYEDYKEEITQFVMNLSEHLLNKSYYQKVPIDTMSLFTTLKIELDRGYGHLYGCDGEDAYSFYMLSQVRLLQVLQSYRSHQLDYTYYFRELESLAALLVKQFQKRFPDQDETTGLMIYLNK